LKFHEFTAFSNRLAVHAARVTMLVSLLGAQGVATAAAETDPATAAAPGPGLDEIVVTAQRRAERLLDVPITMSSMSGDELRKVGANNVQDLTVAVPGLVFTGQGTAAEPSIRGVSTSVSTPGAPAPVAIYVDGLYQSSQQGNLFNLPDVQQIEVLKGPQGTLYGRNATGGAVLVTSRQPSFTPTGSFTVGDGAFFGGSAASANHFQAGGFLSGPLIADKVAGSIAAAYEDSPGYMVNDVNGRRTGKIQSEFVRAKLLITPTEDLRILLAGTFSSQRDDEATASFPLLTVASQYPGAIVSTQPWHTASEMSGGIGYQKTVHKDVSATVDWTLPEVGVFTSRTGYTETRPLLNADVDGAYAPACVAAFVCATPYVGPIPDNTLQQELTFASQKFGRLSFVAGALYLHDREDAFYNVNPPVANPAPVQPYSGYGYFVFDESVKTNAYAVYLEGTFDITSALTATAGLRYSKETQVEYARQSVLTYAAPTGPYLRLPPAGAPTYNSYTPRVALRYALDSSTNLFASYNRGFKSGVLTGLSLTAPPAKPETIDSFEAGIKHSDERFSFNAAGFYYKYRDLQVQFFNGIQTLTANAAAAKSYGFDADGAIRIAGGLKVQAGVSWIPYAKYSSFPNGVDFALPLTAAGLSQVNVDATGARLLRDPKYTANLTVDYAHDTSLGLFDGSLTVYRSDSYDWDLLRRVKTDAYTTLNGQVSVTLPSSPWKLTVYGRNLTNKAYILSVINSTQADEVAFGRPREVGLNVNYTF
jgi:iron complex outermembrane receptor protein